MQSGDEVKIDGADIKSGDNDSYERRKRVNRMKKAILIIAIVLLLLPIICCIFLGIQVSRLQKEVDYLTAAHLQYKVQNTPAGNMKSIHNGKKYVYAAVKDDTLNEAPSGKPKDSGNTPLPQKNDYGPKVSRNVIQTFPKSEGNTKDTNKVSKLDTGIYAGKKVYLTFDDGPSIYTGKILDILSDYHIKATFFVIGKTDLKSKELYRRIVKEGHTLGMHSYSHDYEKIYKSSEDFDKDFTKLRKLLYDTTGYKPDIYRFPGGSDNLVNRNGMEEFIRYLNKASIVYFDWNVVNGDATDVTYDMEQLKDNVLEQVADKERSIVLMHDSQTKSATVASLPELINSLVSGGAQILPLNSDVAPIQMIKADSTK